MNQRVSSEPTAPDQRLRVRLVQHASSLDPADNLAFLDAHRHLGQGCDLVVLPEAFARDFGEPGSRLGPYAESVDGAFGSRLAEVARAGDAAWVGGMFEAGEDPERPFNTLVLSDGTRCTTYRKIHLYDSFGHRESETVSPGQTVPVLTELGGFQVGLMTCYDLRFPELGRALAAQGAEVLVLPAAWVAGERKVEHWRTLVRARAIENTAYVVAVGQPGPRYIGHSLVVAPSGDILAEAGEGEEVLEAELSRSEVAAVRRSNPSLANRRM